MTGIFYRLHEVHSLQTLDFDIFTSSWSSQALALWLFLLVRAYSDLAGRRMLRQ